MLRLARFEALCSRALLLLQASSGHALGSGKGKALNLDEPSSPELPRCVLIHIIVRTCHTAFIIAFVIHVTCAHYLSIYAHTPATK